MSVPRRVREWMNERDWQASDFAPLASFLVIFLFFAACDIVKWVSTGSWPYGFLSLNTVSLVLGQGSVLAVAAAGLTFVLLCGEIDLSVATVALLSACICGVLFEQPFAAGPGGDAPIGAVMIGTVIIIPMLLALVIGLLSGCLTVLSGLPSFIITLAMMNIATGLARYVTQAQKFDVPAVLTTVGNDSRYAWGVDWPFSAIVAALVMSTGHVVLAHSRFGRYVYMTGGNREAARLAGVRVKRIVVSCLVVSAFCASIAGLMNAGRMERVTLEQNADLLLDAVACVVLGGTSLFGGEGSMLRTLLGVVTFMVLKVGLGQLQVPFISNFEMLRPFVLGTVLMLSLVINGYLSKRTKRS